MDIGVGSATTYDLNGKIKTIKRSTGSTVTYTYYAGKNQLQNTDGSGNDYTYDVTGNTNFSSPMSTFSFTYDPFTQLTMVEDNGGTTNDSLEYGGARQRVFKKTTVSAGQNIVVGGGLSPMLSGPTITTMLYIHGGNDYPIMEKISTGEDKMYVYGPIGLIAMRDNSTWYYVHKDHLGSVRVLATSSGTASSSYDYDVYGKIGRSSVNVDITYKFTGQEFDGETGLYNFRARLYDNTVGVFYAVDPAHENFSQYGYVGGNPVSFVDPTGRVTASSPLIADMIEEGYASFHTPGDPFGNQGGGGGGGYDPFTNWIDPVYGLPTMEDIDKQITAEAQAQAQESYQAAHQSYLAGIAENPSATVENYAASSAISTELGGKVGIDLRFWTIPISSPVSQISDEGISFIASWESERLNVYTDIYGNPTIGFGHVLLPSETYTTIDDATSRQLLRQDVQVAVDAVNQNIDVALNQHQFDALVSFTFNVGQGSLSRSTLRTELNSGNFSNVASLMMRYNGDGNPGLTNRRQAEIDLFTSGTYGR